MDTKKRKSFALIVILFCSLFFTLGIKPVIASSGTSQIYWGAFVGPSHKVPYSALQTFENQVGKSVSIWNWIQLWNRPKDRENSPVFEQTWMDECRNHGAIPMISWSPEASDEAPEFTNLQSILDGKEDTYLKAWGQASAAWGHPYFIRLMWEFTGSWTDNNPNGNPPFYGYGIYPWGNGNTPEKFVQAWQRIVDKVRDAGGTQISWVWCPAAIGDSVSTLQSLYPGENYVDWVGPDIYLVAGQHLSDFSEINTVRTVAPNKPMMFPEFGYKGDESASWWPNFLGNELPNQYPYIKAIVFWQDPANGWDNTIPSTLPAFSQAISSSYFSSNTYRSLNTSPITPLGNSPNPTLAPASTPSGVGGLHMTATFAVVSGATAVVVLAVCLLVYFKKRKHQE